MDNVLIIMIVGRDSFVRGTTGLLRKIELFMGCSLGFKYAKNTLASGAPPWTPLRELTLPQTSYSAGVDGREGARGRASQTMDKKIKTQLPRYA